jgi:L-arabinose isomerase
MEPTKRRVSRPAPRVGLLITSIDVFSPEAKDRSEAALRAYFDTLLAGGAIAPGSLVRGRVENPHEALAAADDFAAAVVDLVVIANVAFPNGNVFTAVATHPHLRSIPLAVVSDPEPPSNEWGTNAWCGVIMNNYAAVQMGRPIAAIPGPTTSTQFHTEFERLLRVAGTIKGLRRDVLCRLGEAPGGFHCASGNQLAYAATFGTRVETIDLTAFIGVYGSGCARGPLGESAFTESDVAATVTRLAEGCAVEVDGERLSRSARVYHTLRAMVRANGYTSLALRCWPEFNEPYIDVTPCAAMGLLLADGEVSSASCESDWPTAVMQTICAFLSDRPAACLDWVNHTGGSDIIQLGHCGVGIPGQMAAPGQCRVCSTLTVHPVIRQAGGSKGPVHVGQFAPGPKTGVGITQTPDGRFRMLAFRGESGPGTDLGIINSSADIRVPQFRQLNRLILDNGFPHHLAMAMSDITGDLRLLCRFLGVEYLTPEA